MITEAADDLDVGQPPATSTRTRSTTHTSPDDLQLRSWSIFIDEIAAGLNAAQRRSSGRFEIIDRPDCVTINDAYNANPESMRAGLHAFRALASSRRTIAVRAAGRRRGPGTSKWADWWPNSASTC
ncbi:cyanophycin synthetase [Streptomyces decoyicus]|nr:cyanophycin synthetase [Streptomyces sp. MCA2]MCL7494769.1 hypothetical protein [Streptomyces sp. MCA2]